MLNHNEIALPNMTLQLTWHAQKRMSELKVTRSRVQYAAQNYDTSIPVRHGRHDLFGPGIILTVDWTDRVIITVKLRTNIPYEHHIHTLDNLPQAG